MRYFLLVLFGAALALCGCENGIKGAVYEFKLKNAETELQKFVIVEDDTTSLTAPTNNNFMDQVLYKHAEDSSLVTHRTYFEEGGRAVSYYYITDTASGELILHHYFVGEWEMRGPDRVYLKLGAQLLDPCCPPGSLFPDKPTFVITNDGEYEVIREGRGKFALVCDANVSDPQLIPFALQEDTNRVRLEVTAVDQLEE